MDLVYCVYFYIIAFFIVINFNFLYFVRFPTCFFFEITVQVTTKILSNFSILNLKQVSLKFSWKFLIVEGYLVFLIDYL